MSWLWYQAWCLWHHLQSDLRSLLQCPDEWIAACWASWLTGFWHQEVARCWCIHQEWRWQLWLGVYSSSTFGTPVTCALTSSQSSRLNVDLGEDPSLSSFAQSRGQWFHSQAAPLLPQLTSKWMSLMAASYNQAWLPHRASKLRHDTDVLPAYTTCIGKRTPLADIKGTRVKACLSSCLTVATCLTPILFQVILVPCW